MQRKFLKPAPATESTQFLTWQLRSFVSKVVGYIEEAQRKGVPEMTKVVAEFHKPVKKDKYETRIEQFTVDGDGKV